MFFVLGCLCDVRLIRDFQWIIPSRLELEFPLNEKLEFLGGEDFNNPPRLLYGGKESWKMICIVTALKFYHFIGFYWVGKERGSGKLLGNLFQITLPRVL